jgi:hypothetical protein
MRHFSLCSGVLQDEIPTFHIHSYYIFFAAALGFRIGAKAGVWH